jgi:hypothetical protein
MGTEQEFRKAFEAYVEEAVHEGTLEGFPLHELAKDFALWVSLGGHKRVGDD